MTLKLNKTVVVMIVLILWTIFSIGFICVTKVNEFKIKQLTAAANQGFQQAIIEVATAANKCEQTGVPLNVGTDKDGKAVTVTIVGVSCLQAAEKNASTPAATEAAPKK